MKRLTVLAIVLMSASTVACLAGKDGAPGPAGPPGAGPAGGGGGAGEKPADKPADKPGDAPPAPPAAPTKTGTVLLTQMSFTVGDQEINSYSASAMFIDATGAVAGTGGAKCTTSKEGSCDVTVCDIPESGGSSGTPPPAAKASPTAGDITITGAADEEATLTADDKGLYTPASGQTKLLAAGEEVKVKAKGKEVPAFDKTVKAPSAITVTAPEFPAPGEAFAINRTADLEFTWENGTAGDVQASISSITDKKVATIACTFKADAGTGKITKAALSKLIVSEQGSISVSGLSSTAFDQGGWKITLQASSPGSLAAGGVASGTARIE